MSLSDQPAVVKFNYAILEWLTDAGVPIILAHLHADRSFSLEPGWPTTKPGLANVHRFLMGDGSLLAAMTGVVYDVFDFDVQNGGDLAEFLTYWRELGHETLTCQAISRTPSGGFHIWVRTLNQRKVPIARGIDYQGNKGIAFIPPSRKFSKTTKRSERYRWVDYSPGGDDDGKAIHSALLEWPDHRPTLPTTGNGNSSVGYHVDRTSVSEWRKTGVPDDLPHDDTLRDVIWFLCKSHAPEHIALAIWQDIVDATEPKHGRRPFEPERDFERHWRGAERKLRGGR